MRTSFWVSDYLSDLVCLYSEWNLQQYCPWELFFWITTSLQRFLLQSSVSPAHPRCLNPAAPLSPDLKPVLLLTFTHSTEAFIQSDIQLSWTTEGLVQGPNNGSWAMSGTWVGSRNVLINVYTMHYNIITDDSGISVLYISFRMLLLRKALFSQFSELCSHNINTSHP